MPKKLVALIILDGWGDGVDFPGNAITHAKKPNYDRLINEYPNTEIEASGLDVGLPEGQMGNSEVGHLNIGAGRVVYQDLTRITKSIQDGDFFEKEEFLEAVDRCKANDSKLHIMGLLSPGGVHSHMNHLFALLELAKRHDLEKVYVHGFLDGRDVPPKSAREYVEEIQAKIAELGVGRIATLTGRYYAMDRDNRWDRVEKAFNAMVMGEGVYAEDPVKAVADSYGGGVSDEFVDPVVMTEGGKPVATMDDGDSVIFINFRPDRAREITRAIVDVEFSHFDRRKRPDVLFVGMSEYDKTIENMKIAYKSEEFKNTLGEYVSKKGLKQLRIAETEKYAHVTFFFNGGVEQPNENEDRVLIPSPKVATYDLKPDMSAYEVAYKAVENIKSGEYDLMILNFANPDMVGHTGDIRAAVKAIETVDDCLGRVVDAIVESGGEAVITADHGNAEEMSDYVTGATMTAHTTNPVPCIVVCEDDGTTVRDGGRLADLAPTLLDMMGLDKPEEMTGTSLIQKNK